MTLTYIVYLADRVELCEECVAMRYSTPSCTGCGEEALSGWPALGRPHKDCPQAGRFQAADDGCEMVVPVRVHPETECALCASDIPARGKGQV